MFFAYDVDLFGLCLQVWMGMEGKVLEIKE